jgi:hypothetical protein
LSSSTWTWEAIRLASSASLPILVASAFTCVKTRPTQDCVRCTVMAHHALVDCSRDRLA